MEKEKVQRINALAKKAKGEGLSDGEKEEQAALRAEYLAEVRQNLKSTLDHVYIQNEDGSTTKLKKKGQS